LASRFYRAKSHFAHIAGLAEIPDWAKEFYNQYYDKIINWERHKQSSDNIYNIVTPYGLIVTFGRAMIKKFYAQNANQATYFL